MAAKQGARCGTCFRGRSPPGRRSSHFEEAARSRRILLTSDLDFGEILARSSGRVSVVILRLRSNATANVTGRLEVALAQAGSALEHGAVVIVGEASLRLRRLPLGG